MSKMKAKQRAQKRIEERKKQEKQRINKVEQEKQSFALQQHKCIERNKAENLVEADIKARMEQKNSPISKYLKNKIPAIVEEVLAAIENKELAYEFVLEELDAAYLGSDTAKEFAVNSGIPIKTFMGALSGISNIDGATGPQQTLLRHSMALINNGKSMDYAVAMRTTVVDHVMKHYAFGMYSAEILKQSHLEKVTELNDEYQLFLKNPKKAGVDKLLSQMIPLAECISDERFEKYRVFLKILDLCRGNIQARIIPTAMQDRIMTDFTYLCLIRQDRYLQAIKATFNSGVQQELFVKALDLPRQFGNIEHGTAVINVAPVINNIIHYIFTMLPDDYFVDQQRPIVETVVGAITTSIDSLNKLTRWIKSEVGYEFEGDLVTDPTLDFVREDAL